MPRKPRIEFRGAIYHVYQRGNNKEYIFKNEIEKGFFIKQIKENMLLYNYEILAFAIMDNHYHIIIRTNETPLNKIMHSINTVYGKSYNFNHTRTGHVFENRYNCRLIEDDAYLIWLIRYIHRNPVRAHLCDSAKDYKWSSDNLYRRNRKIFVNIDFILEIFSQKRSDAIRTYIKLMDNLPEDNKEIEYEEIKKMDFRISLYGNLYTNTVISYRKSLECILNDLNLELVDVNLIKSGSKKRYLTDLKIKFINLAVEHKYTLKDIGEFIGVSQSAISKLIIAKTHNS